MERVLYSYNSIPFSRLYILSVSKKVISLRYNIFFFWGGGGGGVGGLGILASSLSLFTRNEALKLKINHKNINKLL